MGANAQRCNKPMPQTASLLSRCLDLCANGQLDEAADRLAAELDAAPEDQREALRQAQQLVRWRLAAQVGRNADGLTQAIDAMEYLGARGHAPQLAWCYGSLGLSVALAGDLELGLRYADRGLDDARQREDRIEVCMRLNGKGAVLAVSGQRPQALLVYAEALGQLPEVPEALATRLLLLNNWAYSLIMLARAERDDITAREDLARQALHQAERARAWLGEAQLTRDWRGAWTLSNIGAALALLGQRQAAEQAFDQAWIVAKDHHRVALGLAASHARLLLEAGRLDEARRLLETLIATEGEQPLDPTVDDLLESRMNLEIRAGQVDAALDWASRRFERLENRHRLQIATVRRLLGLFQRIEQEQRAEREQAQRQLRFWQDEALRDPLCGTLNRRGLQVAAQTLLLAERPMAVLLLDLDHFKSVNDRFGHAVGDRVLAEAAQRMQGAIREGDLLARMGGEEFCVVLPGCALEPALRIAEKLRLRVAETDWSHLGADLRVSVSGGLASGSGDGPQSLEALIAVADRHLYLAKGQGRNRIQS